MKEYSYQFSTNIKRLGEIGPCVNDPKMMLDWLKDKIFKEETSWKEQSVAVFTNINNRIIGFETISIGTPDKCTFDVKMVCRTALDVLADGVIIVHNHPSGDSSPSLSDIVEAQKMKKALNTLQIKLVDFLIIGDKESYSFDTEKKYNYL